MRNEALTGYLLHQRPYQEKRALYYLFSQQFGVVHGIGKKGAPLFEALQLFATGKRDLKTFSQIAINQTDNIQIDSVQIVDNPNTKPPYPSQNIYKAHQRYQQISGQQQYAALYLNEVLLKLLPVEDPMPMLWQHYQSSLMTLKQPLSADELRLCLRQFEQRLFQELGFALNVEHDTIQDSIDPTMTYRFLADVGLVPILQAEHSENANTQAIFNGDEILAMQQKGITLTTLNSWSRLHRHLIDHLLDYQPLQSRLLWQQQQRYQ